MLELAVAVIKPHQCYLAKGAYLLPENTVLDRKIVGLTNGSYTYE